MRSTFQVKARSDMKGEIPTPIFLGVEFVGLTEGY
jgi:hypothetical protein